MKKIFCRCIFLLFISFSITAQIKLTCSKAQYFSEKPNRNGVYPVLISFESSLAETDLYIVYANDKTQDLSLSKNEKQDFLEIKQINPKKNADLSVSSDGNKISFLHFEQDFIPGQKNCYKIKAFRNENNALVEIGESNIDFGWGALTPESYFILFNKIITFSHSKLVLMNKPKTMDKLGKETISGNISGTLEYKTSLKGVNGVVTMVYDNYSDDSNWIITGEMNTKANISANGTMFGTINVDGMYPGRVYYENVVIKDSKAGGGTYDVQPLGFEKEQLNYSVTFIDYEERFISQKK